MINKYIEISIQKDLERLEQSNPIFLGFKAKLINFNEYQIEIHIELHNQLVTKFFLSKKDLNENQAMFRTKVRLQEALAQLGHEALE